MAQSNDREITVSLISGSDVTVDVTIETTPTFGRTFAVFPFLGKSYNFAITKWSGGGNTRFLRFFHQYHAPRAQDRAAFEQQFGRMVASADPSEPPVFQGTIQEKLNCIAEGVADIFKCLRKILEVHQKALLDYAVWYRDKKFREDTADYSDYITYITCCCIIHESFLGTTQAFTVVRL